MRSQDDKIQFLKGNLLDDQTIIDELSAAASDLHMLLKRWAPPIDSSNPVIGIRDLQGNYRPGCETVSEYYKDKKRIEFLLLGLTNIPVIIRCE
ncbi:hypothetical protein [Brevibacillus nitrificans]|uniref:hypothetical protein n=1 Tax=Brevibacillus nitrificans TaxID=651560 RepID=UPI0028553C46|nr:hypothetical protein [Brevibacillus nitrificans]MDR7317533.1 hypothetical protein [Brevibacillus nitrificans]